jgi:hypothetical protein
VPDTPSFTRRAHRPGDEQMLLDMLDLAFGRPWPRVEIGCDPVDHLRWKLSNTPESPGIHRITEVDGKPAASVFCWIQNVKLRDGIYRNIQGVDSVAHPAFQTLGLFRARAEWRKEHPDDQPSDFQFGPVSGHPALAHIHQKAEQEGRSLVIGNRVRVLTLPLGEDAGERIERAAPKVSNTGCDIQRVEAFDERTDDFWLRAAEPYEFIVERTRDQLNWRYADPRAGLFSIHVAEHEGELLGYSALRLSHGRGFIADLLTLPDQIDVASALLEDAVYTLAALSVSRIDWWVPVHHPYQQLARERGFVDKRIVEISLFPHNPALDLTYLADPAVPVHIAAGDTDLV